MADVDSIYQELRTLSQSQLRQFIRPASVTTLDPPMKSSSFAKLRFNADIGGVNSSQEVAEYYQERWSLMTAFIRNIANYIHAIQDDVRGNNISLDRKRDILATVEISVRYVSNSRSSLNTQYRVVYESKIPETDPEGSTPEPAGQEGKISEDGGGVQHVQYLNIPPPVSW